MQSFSLCIRRIHRPRLRHLSWFSGRQKSRGETVELPIGGSGGIQLEILPPPSALSGTNNNILIYLPPSGSASSDVKDGSSESQIPNLLTSILPTSTVITLRYRLCPPTHPFPVPIHDTAIAFNHVLHHHHTLTRTHVDPTAAAPKISLLGSRIGGTLATTLALTSPATSIHSVAVSEPIPDWVSLDTGIDETTESTISTLPAKRKGRPKQSHDSNTTSDAKKSLLTLRARLFPRPDNYFDPFASPTLFLRAPGRDCPQPYLKPSVSPGSIGAEALFDPYDSNNSRTYRSRLSVSSPSAPADRENKEEEEDDDDEDGNDAAAALKPVKRRKVLRRWPPNGPPESVRLPYFRVFVSDDREGEGLVMRQQGEELVELMRRVCFYGQEREVADKRVGADVLPGAEREGGLLGIREAAKWLARKQEEQE